MQPNSVLQCPYVMTFKEKSKHTRNKVLFYFFKMFPDFISHKHHIPTCTAAKTSNRRASTIAVVRIEREKPMGKTQKHCTQFKPTNVV